MTPTRPIRSQLALPGAITVAVTAALLLVGRSAGRAQSPSPTPSSGGLASSSPLALGSPGRLLYQQDCAWCHGADGGGTANGPSLVGVGAASADFMLRTGRMPISSAEEAPQRTRPMYASDQIAALDGFVASLGAGPAIPTIDPMAGRLGEGQQLYEIHCAACHSSTGAGSLRHVLRLPIHRTNTTRISSAPTQVTNPSAIGPTCARPAPPRSCGLRRYWT